MLATDERMYNFKKMTEDEKDKMTCDDIFCMYLRHVSKLVNENYYKQCLRFVLLYRECLNEYGWLKRRETYLEAGMINEDTLLASLKTAEEQNERDEGEFAKIEAEINSEDEEDKSEKEASPKKGKTPAKKKEKKGEASG